MIAQLGINNLFCFDYCVNSGFPNSLYNFTTFARKWGFPFILHKIQFRLFNGHDITCMSLKIWRSELKHTKLEVKVKKGTHINFIFLIFMCLNLDIQYFYGYVDELTKVLH